MPGYTSDLYNYISTIDPTFRNDVSLDQFKSKMSDVGYSKNMYDWIGQNDKTFHSDVSFDLFREKLGYKKKEPTVSPSVQKPKPISSDTQPKVTQKPSGTSVSQNKVEVFTNFPGKENNQYRIVNNNWQRKEPGKDWTTVRDSNAIIGLNKQYKKTIVPVEGFEGISGKLIDNSEETVVPYLQKNYGRLGFNFEQTGAGDRVRVVTQDGKNSETFMLDNWTDEGDSSEAVRLKAWLKENMNTIDREKYNKVDEEISAIKNITPKQRESLQSDAFAHMDADIPKELALDFKTQLKLKEKEKEAMQYNKSRMDALMTDINKAKQTKGKEDDAEVRARVAAVYGNKDEIAKQNRYISNSLNDIARVSVDLNRKSKEYDDEVTRWQSDLAKNNGVETPELAERKLALQGRAEMLNKEVSSLDENVKLSKSYQTKLDDIAGEYMLFKEGKGSTGGAMINNFLKGATNIWRFAGLEKSSQEELIKLIGSDYTTQEYATSKERSDIEKVLFSLSNSIGAAVGGAGVGTFASFYAQTYYDVKDEIDSNPEFNGVPELEKTLVASTIGLTVGWLEKFGLDKIMSKNPISKTIVNKILLKTVGDLPKNATAEMLEQAINTNVKALLAKGAINVAGGAFVEGSTEFAQELAEGGIKKLYNAMKGKELFNEPESLLAQSFEAAYLGAMGGAIMQSPVQATKAIADGISNKNKLAIEILEKSVTDAELRSMMVSKIKSQIVNGELTKEEGQKQIDAVNEAANTFDKLPDNITDEDRSKSFDLLIEKSKIEKEIAGKDENLVAVQRARIAEINNELKTISEDATKKSTEQQQEVTAEGGGLQREGVDEGQPQVREGERPVGETAQQGPDISNRPVEGRRTEEARVTRDVVNRPATLTEFGGKKLDIPLNGDVYVDGQQVVFEDRNTGRVYELGNVDEVMDTEIPGLTQQQERVSITPEGKVSLEGNNWNIQSELPTQGIEYNPAGEVMRVSLKDDAGNTKMFTGQDAVDIAYQIELQKYQTPEQQQLINDLLEQDEEFQAATEFIKPAEITTVVQEEAAPTTVPTEPTAVTEEVVTPELETEVDRLKKFIEGKAPAKEKIVQEEKVVTPELEAEVQKLGKLIEGTDEQIDEQLGRLDLSNTNSYVVQSVANAAKSISKVLPNVKFVVHDTDESYRKATGEEGRTQSTRGTFDFNTNTIHINLNKANDRTAAHEVFHAVLLSKVKTDIEAQRLTKAMIDAVSKSLVNMEDAGQIISYLNDFVSDYETNVQNEEKLAELVGILSDNYLQLPPVTKNIIKRFLDRIAKLFGLKPITDREVIDFMNVIAIKTAIGDEITKRDIRSLPKSKQIAEANKRFQADFSDAISKLTFVFDKNGETFKRLEKDGYITRDKSLSDFNGKYIFLHQPDAAFSGAIYKDGEILVEGKGGVFYPIKFHEDGYFWASTDRTAKKMAEDLNKVMEQNGGTIYMALTSAPSDKLMSSTTMANAILDFFSSKAFDKNFKVTPTQFKNALRKAANDIKTVNNKKVGLDLKLPSTATIEEMQSAIKTALGSENSSFADRKNFAIELTKIMAGEINKNDVAINQFGKLFSEGIQNKYFKGITKTGKLKISATNMTQALSEMFTEPMLKEGIDREKGGQVYAILELNGPVKAVKSDKHESYPMAIESENKNNKVTLHLLNDRQNWSDTFEDFETNDIVSKDRQLKVFPTSGVSVQGLKVNTSKVSPRKQQAKGINQIISIAKQNGFSDAAIRKYLLDNGFDRNEVYDALPVEKKAPSVAKILGKKPKKVTVDEAAALKDQIRLEARAAREAQADIKTKQRRLVDLINSMKTTGKINVNQATALTKRISRTNVDNPIMVQRMLDYAERLFENAEYQDILSNAFRLRNKIKKAAKSKDKIQAEVAGMAKKFSKIDPSLVEDIDTYMEIADKVFNAVRPVRLTKEGLVTKIATDIAKISEYQTKEIKRQEEILKKETMDMYKYLVDSGAISSEMSLKEIKDVITILENNPDADVTDRESIIRDYVKKAFKEYSNIIIDMVQTGFDPLTGEEISFDENQKDVIKRLIGIDTDFMKLEDAYKSIEALDNFIVNKITSGVEAIVNSYEGKLNADVMAKSGIKTRPLKLFFTKIGGRAMAENFATLPVLIDTMFGGVGIGQKFMNLSGLNDFANGVAKATKEQNNIINEYGEKFEKSKPNGMDFRAAENVYERGMIAYLSRTIDGSISEQRQELGRRIGIIRDSIESLKDGDKDQKRISEIYQSLYDKLNLDKFNINNDNLTISDIQSKADKANVEAVKWWTEKWAEKYSDLSDVSLSVYNTELGSDLNYTPDRYSRVTGEDNPISDLNLQKAGAFGMDLNFTDKNKSGVLMESTRPQKTPGRYVNLDFDISNARSMKAALVDINTAGSVRKIDGFLRSPSMNKIVEDKKDREVLQRRINNYVRRSKNKAVITDATLRDLDDAFNYIASIGAVKALGGIFQPIKQTLPVMINTIINAGPQNMSFASVFGDSDMHEWINKSGMSIANRGLEASTAVETANKYLDKVAGSKGEAAVKGLMQLNQFWLKTFLQKPDVWIARSSFIAYYKQALRRKGVDVSNIDWKNHSINKEAANYAQHMVDRQQNVSDAAMMGEIMASESGSIKILRKTLLPFANFIMNQKSRMYSDFRTMLSKDANKDDKKAAVRSLSGLTLELGMYQYLSYMIGMSIKSLAANLVGYEPDDEEEKKNKKYAIQNATNQYIKDILSPLPTTDGATLYAVNWIADKIQDFMVSDDEVKDAIKEENKVREEMGEDPMDDKQSQKFKEEFIENGKLKFEDYKENKLFNLGVLSIAADKISELYDMVELARTGKFTDESFGVEKTKYISKEDQKMMGYLSALKFASLSGALPVESNNLAMYSTKYIKKKAITENQFDKSQEVKKELGLKELKEYQMALVRSKKKTDGILEEINWVENNGGFKNKKQEQAYIKMIQSDQEVTNSDLSKIQSIK